VTTRGEEEPAGRGAAVPPSTRMHDEE
jgi:hypothetical protein